MRKKIIAALCLLSMQVWAQDSLQTKTLAEVVVTGTKYEVPVEKSGKVIFKFSPEVIQQFAGRSVADMLNFVPGVQMDGNFSTPGMNISYYVRGGRNRHTVVAIDGIPMVDPSGIEPYFDLRFLPLDQFQSAEVLQGSLSTLYGSSAAAGVINLQTTSVTTDGVKGSVQVTGGSWETFSQALQLQGRFNKTSFSFSGNNLQSEGFSAALDDDPTVDFDNDGIKRRNVFLKIGHEFTKALSLDVFSSYDWLNNEFDTWTFTDGDESQQYEQFRYGLRGQWHYTKGTLSVLAQQSLIHRDEHTDYPTVYTGNSIYSEVMHRHTFSSWLTTISGVTFQRMGYGEKNVNEADTTFFTMADPYMSFLLTLPRNVQVHAGLRLNTHSLYGAQLVYNINPSWVLPINSNAYLKLFASLSTAYITPSLFQLYTVWGGNKNLQPERDENAEAGFSVVLDKKVQSTFAYYYRTEMNAIGYSALLQYINVDVNRYVSGLTADVKWDMNSMFSVSVNYAYTHVNLPQTFFRIPGHKTGASLAFTSKGTSAQVRYLNTGKRTDSNYPDEVVLSAYDLVDVYVAQALYKKKFNVFMTVNNLLNEDFVAVYGYTTQGRNFSAGMKYVF